MAISFGTDEAPFKGVHDLQLTPSFRLREFAVSAEHPELANAMRFTEIEATKLFYLCSFILQPLRDLVGRPIEILSGKRTPELNAAIGGSKTSQHLECEAADFNIVGAIHELPLQGRPGLPVGQIGQTQSAGQPRGVAPIFGQAQGPAPTLKTLDDIFGFMARNWAQLYHQLIIYYTDDWRPRFIHVSLPPSPVFVGAIHELPLQTKRKGAFYHRKGQYYKVALKRSEGVKLK